MGTILDQLVLDLVETKRAEVSEARSQPIDMRSTRECGCCHGTGVEMSPPVNAGERPVISTCWDCSATGRVPVYASPYGAEHGAADRMAA